MIDVNVSLGRWPFRRLTLDEAGPLVAKLRVSGVSRAWAGHLDALLHEDLAAVNARLARACENSAGFLVPFGAVHPGLPDWRDDLRRCAEVHGFGGIRLHPDLQGFTLGDPAFLNLLDAAAERKLCVQIACRMEDPRTLHPRLRLALTDLAPLAAAVDARPGLRLMILNGSAEVRSEAARNLAARGVLFDTAMVDGLGALESLTTSLGAGALAFGSHAPVFTFEANALKLRENELPGATREALILGNAERWLARR